MDVLLEKIKNKSRKDLTACYVPGIILGFEDIIVGMKRYVFYRAGYHPTR